MGTDIDLFSLDSRLQKDTQLVGDLPLCQVLLMEDSRFPWLILVPRQDGVHEIWDLSAEDQQILMGEVSHCARMLQFITGAHKINVGTLGNMVRQLHVHVVARFSNDVAWPRSVWGYGGAVGYDGGHRAHFINRLRLEMVSTLK
jgi:diadenosine tetraphosphate (Ap4A) HIT family hydrolase